MSDEAPESKIEDANLRLLKNLEQRNVIELYPIRREVFTGGEYRKVMVEQADAMIAIGGGKGTYSAGRGMAALGKPVLLTCNLAPQLTMVTALLPYTGKWCRTPVASSRIRIRA